jgi:hypothetical protein
MEKMMSIRGPRLAGLALMALLPGFAAHAQLESLLDKGGTQGLAGHLSGQSLASGSLGNVAGLLEFCVTNNFLAGEDTNPVQEQLMKKLPGGTKSSDPGYTDGLKGLLHAKDGKQLDLHGSGVPAHMSKKACDAVLSQAKSLM